MSLDEIEARLLTEKRTEESRPVRHYGNVEKVLAVTTSKGEHIHEYICAYIHTYIYRHSGTVVREGKEMCEKREEKYTLRNIISQGKIIC